MTEAMLISILVDTFMLIALIAGVPVLISMAVGLLISIFQATTQIQEQTLTFVPKLVTVVVVLILLASFDIDLMISYFEKIIEQILLIS